MAVMLTTIFVLIMNVITALLALQLLRIGGASARLRIGVGVTFAAWLMLLIATVSQERLFPADIGGAAFFAILLAVVGGVTALMFTRPLRVVLDALPLELLLVPQGLRVFLGAGFLVQGVVGVMPPAFGIADGLSHVTAGFLAMMAAVVWAQGHTYRFGAWLATLFGVLDIVCVALGIAFVLLPQIGPHHSVMYAAFFVAPIFLGLHAVVAARLLRTSSAPAAGGLQPQPAR
ncbi:MAG: hypothetical protein AAF772_08095 [Acidobacteriota bacterium]